MEFKIGDLVLIGLFREDAMRLRGIVVGMNITKNFVEVIKVKLNSQSERILYTSGDLKHIVKYIEI